MQHGDKTLEWRIARLFVKWWVRRLIRRHVAFLARTEYDRSNMHYAKMRLTQARIAYWRSAFEPWGGWNIGGCGNFVFHGIDLEDCDYRMNQEMEDLGFNQRLEWIDHGPM